MIERIEISTPDGPMPATVADAGSPKGAVIVIQEAFGLTPHIEDVTARLGAAGWVAVAPALFHRQGSPVFDYEDLSAVMAVFKDVRAADILTDVDAALAFLAAEGFSTAQCAIVGFCMGGSVTLHAAVAHPFGAAVTYYGGGVATGRFGFPSLVDAAPGLQSPWLGLFGDLDQGIPVEDVEQLRTAAATASVPTEIVRYADADHGFNCDDRPKVYNPDAATDAWSRTLAWFEQHVATQ
jgi:carboxymethylenebutenolidase